MPIVDARVIVVWATPAGANINTMDVQYDDVASTPATVGQSIVNNLQGTVMSQMADNVSLTSVQVGDDISGAIVPGTASGSLNQDNSNPSICFGVTKVVTTGRNGRFFVPGVTEFQTTDTGEYITGLRATLQTLWENFLAAITSEGVDMVVRQKDGSLAPVATLNVRPFVSLQSRRFNRLR